MPNQKLHDKLFRKSLSNLAIAKDFIATHVPQHVLAKFDINTIKFHKTSYVEDKLKEQITDIVYRVKMLNGINGYLIFLIEHQSSPIKLMPFRVLKYQINIISDHIEQHPNDKLPIVFPILYYCGVEKPYPYTLNVLDLFCDYTLAEQTLTQPIHLVDVTTIPDEVIIQHKLIGLLELVQKHIKDKDLSLISATLKQIITNITNQKHVDSGLLRYIKINLYYIILLGNIERPNEFLNQLEEVPMMRGKIMGTLAHKFKDEGKEEGKLEQAKSMALKMLQDGMCCSAIAKYTGLSKEEVKNLDSTHKCNH
jgi:predicted transposase/invertase (TIGR01784 family)